VRSGDLLYISGQVSIDESGGIKGTVGVDVDLEKAQAAARLCGVNLIAQMRSALGGDLDRVKRVVKLAGFVQAARTSSTSPRCVNGCSDPEWSPPLARPVATRWSAVGCLSPADGLCRRGRRGGGGAMKDLFGPGLGASVRSAIAHRGLWDGARARELPARLPGACQAGYGIELDVQALGRRRGLVFHDATWNG